MQMIEKTKLFQINRSHPAHPCLQRTGGAVRGCIEFRDHLSLTARVSSVHISAPRPIFRPRSGASIDRQKSDLLPTPGFRTFNARQPTTEGRMTKAELVEVVAAQSRLTKKSAAEILDIVFANIGKAVKKDSRFSYPGFGTWSLRSRKARKIRNPQTNEMMKLKASKTIGFRPAKELKNSL
jgi:DNA-binding protein HU-beta